MVKMIQFGSKLVYLNLFAQRPLASLGFFVSSGPGTSYFCSVLVAVTATNIEKKEFHLDPGTTQLCLLD